MDADRLLYGGSSGTVGSNDFIYPIVGDDQNNMIENVILESSYYMQPPHYSLLGNSSSTSSNNFINIGSGSTELPHEYSNNYSTVIVTQQQQELDNSCRRDGTSGGGSGGVTNYTNYTNQSSQLPTQLQTQTLDYRLLSSVKEDEEPISHSSTSKGGSRPEYRYSGSDFSMSECISNSNTSTLGNKSRNRNHIITDTLPGPESCV